MAPDPRVPALRPKRVEHKNGASEHVQPFRSWTQLRPRLEELQPSHLPSRMKYTQYKHKGLSAPVCDRESCWKISQPKLWKALKPFTGLGAVMNSGSCYQALRHNN